MILGLMVSTFIMAIKNIIKLEISESHTVKCTFPDSDDLLKINRNWRIIYGISSKIVFWITCQIWVPIHYPAHLPKMRHWGILVTL
jgi:hypothetical protein